MTIFALDLATQTGWAVVTCSGKTLHGTVSFKSSSRPELFKKFAAWLVDQIVRYEPTIIVYEKPNSRFDLAKKIAFGMGAITELMAARMDIAVTEVSASAIKKHITGNGAAKKRAVIDAIREMGFIPDDDNAADALALAHYVFSKAVFEEAA